MVQGVTDAGENWSYSKTIDSTGLATVSASDVVTACGTEITSFALSDFSKCNIWLERTSGEEGCTVTYASAPLVAGATDSTCTLEPVSQIDATCTAPGLVDHWNCSVCGQLFSDAEGKNPIDEPTAIPTHGLTKVDKKAATCTESAKIRPFSSV